MLNTFLVIKSYGVSGLIFSLNSAMYSGRWLHVVHDKKPAQEFDDDDDDDDEDDDDTKLY